MKGTGPLTHDQSALIDEIVADLEVALTRLGQAHTPEFLEIDITMPQAKVLYLLRAAGELHMSDLVARLGVTLPTVSGIVDRLVEHGLVARRGNPDDRRRVFVGITPAGTELVDRFRDLNSRQIRELLGVLDEHDLDAVRAFMAVLDRGIDRLGLTSDVTGAVRPVPAVPFRSTVS